MNKINHLKELSIFIDKKALNNINVVPIIHIKTRYGYIHI